MATELTVDTTVLRDHGSRLKLIATEFNSADTVADIAEEAVGVHPDTEGLRHQINGFSSSWRIRREEMQGDIETLQGYIEQVASAFEDSERQLQQGIADSQKPVDFSAAPAAGTGASSQTPASGGGGGGW